MFHLQKLSRCLISARYIASKYSSSSATQILPNIADKSSLKTGGNTIVQKTKSIATIKF